MSKSLWRSKKFNSYLKVVYLHIEDVWRTTLVLMPKRSKGNIVSSESRRDENGRSIVNSSKKFRLRDTFSQVNVVKGALVNKSFANAEAANDCCSLLLAGECRRTISSTSSHANRLLESFAPDEANIKLLSTENKQSKPKTRKRKKKRYKISIANDVLPISETVMADHLLPDGGIVEFATTIDAADENSKSCLLSTIAADRLTRKKRKKKKRRPKKAKQKYSLLTPFRSVSGGFNANSASSTSLTERDIFKKVDVQSIRLKIQRRKLSAKLNTAKSSISSAVAEKDYAKLSLKELVDIESIRRKVFQRKLAERYAIAMSDDNDSNGSGGNYVEDEIEKLINLNLEQLSNSAKKSSTGTLSSDGNVSVKEKRAGTRVKRAQSDVEECNEEAETNVNTGTIELLSALREDLKTDQADPTSNALRRSKNSADEYFGGFDRFSTSDMDISEDENTDDYAAYFSENDDISRKSEERSNERRTIDVDSERAETFFNSDRLNVDADVRYGRSSQNSSNWRWNFRRWNTGYPQEMAGECCNNRDYFNSYRGTVDYRRPCQNVIPAGKPEGFAQNRYHAKNYRRYYDCNEEYSYRRKELSYPSDELNWRTKRTELCESNFFRNHQMPFLNDNKYRNRIKRPTNEIWTDIAFNSNTLQRRTYSDIVKDKKNMSDKNNYNNNNSCLMNDIDLEQYVKDIRREVFTSYGQSVRNGSELGKRNEIGVFKVISYNVLAQTLLETYRDQLYRANNEEYLVWPRRKQVILDEIKTYDPDIICLQEVDMIHLDNFNEHFDKLGFGGIYKKRTSEKPDGCAIYYRNSMFTLQEHTTVEYNQPQHRYLNRDNIGLVLRLRVNSLKKNIVVANTHLLYNPRRNDIRLSQVQILLAEIERVAFLYNDKNGDPVYSPIIIAGDFNSYPTSPIFEFITKGIMHYKGPEYENQLQQYPKFLFRSLPKDLLITDNCQHAHVVSNRPSVREKNDLRLVKLFNSDMKIEESCALEDCPNDTQTVNKEYDKYFDTGKIKHNLKLNSVYPSKLENGFATTRHDSWCTVDFIFYGPRNDGGESEGDQQLKLISYLNLPTVSEATRMGPIPNKISGSDHLPLLATFHLVPS